MERTLNIKNLISWIFGAIILILGLLNLFLIHPVPGIAFLVFSLIFFPPVDDLLLKKLGFSIPFAGKLVFFIIIIWFTLGVSDLGDLID